MISGGYSIGGILKRGLIQALMLCGTAAVADELAEVNGEWLHRHEAEIVDLLQDDETSVVPVINLLGNTWAVRDGALGSEVSPYIAEALVYRTDSMLAWFAAHRSALDAWLASVPDSLFTNYSGRAAYAEYLADLKARLLASLEGYRGEHQAEAARIADVIATAEVREIR